MMSWLLETGKGEAVTSAFGTEIDAHPRSCYVAFEEGLLTRKTECSISSSYALIKLLEWNW